MLRTLLSVCLLTICFSTQAQNLVPNPSFENDNSCPANNTFTASGWYDPSTGSPDYFIPCGTGWTIPGSSVLFGPQTAHTGSSFAGLGWYNLAGGWYEYIQVQLTSPMTAGDSYTVSMWVSLADQVKRASDDMGIYISTNQFKSTTTILPSITTVIPVTPAGFGPFTTLTPQIKFTDGDFITDVNNWTLISGTYIAAGGEQVITIGCFEPWATTGTLIVNAASGNDRCYYYVDDISVIQDIAAPIELVYFSAVENEVNQVLLSWETTSEANSCYYEIQRSVDATNFQTLNKISAAGNSSSIVLYNYTDTQPLTGLVYYRLKQVDCNDKFSYTQTVSVKTSSLEITAYPNPVQNQLSVLINQEGTNSVNILLQNTLGNIVYSASLENENNIVIPFYDYEKGIYTLSITSDNSKTIHKKIVKQ